MSAEQNKAIVSRWVAGGWNTGDLSLVDEFYADYTLHSPGMPDVHGTEAFKAFVTMYRTAFPDIRHRVDYLVAEGDLVVARRRRVRTRYLPSSAAKTRSGSR